ncbi:carbohydrate ABC transporter permease [uncultured Cohaesibacter sp.]|uniref:carbohydrate ABC transporter permease n=1 Tax=uncultured Cohaesibacter sp. TaxID=1002546 RepID=UPI0029C6A1F4|nr:carbohydrate ABC transporter permease [uncultured Cohaesibacter sp.]
MAEVSVRNEGLLLVSRYLVLGLVAAIFLFPLIFMMVSSLKPDAQLLADTSSFRAFLPVGDVSLDNYFAAFDRAPIGRFMLNSVFVTVTTVLLSLVICSVAAFSFVYLEWSGRNLLLSVILATLIIPFETIAVPLLLLVSRLPWLGAEGLEWGWLNTYQVQIIPWIVDALTVFLFVQYFKDLPRELIEAARAEGASWLAVYRLVVMPLSGPVLATAAILKALKMYNEQYLWPLIVVQDEAHRPIMVGLGYFFQLDVAWGELMAYLTLISIPVLLFYLLMQRAFIASIASTGVKG